MSTVLVTGAAGFIGSHLVDALLALGRAVVGVDNFDPFYAPARKRQNLSGALLHPRFSLVEADIRDAETLARVFAGHRPESVFHLAALAGVRPSLARPAAYTDVNVTGTARVLAAAADHGVLRVVLASSSSVYGNHRATPSREDARLDEPISPYAASKKAAELLAHSLWHARGLPVACARLFTVYGPRQRPDLAIHRFLERVHAGEPVPLFGDGTSSRDYTYVADIVAGLIAAETRLARNPGFGVYNLGGSEPVALATLIETVERVVGRPAVKQWLPPQVGDVERTCADLSRSRRDLGYQPAVSLEQGIARQWAWMRTLGVVGKAGAGHRSGRIGRGASAALP